MMFVHKVVMVLQVDYNKIRYTSIFSKSFWLPPGTMAIKDGDIELIFTKSPIWVVNDGYYEVQAENQITGEYPEGVYEDLEKSSWTKLFPL